MKPVLVTPNLDREIRVKVNTLDFTMGGILLIKCEDEKQRPVTYISKSLNEAKKNYKIHNKVMLGVQRHKGISQRVPKVSSKFRQTIKTQNTL